METRTAILLMLTAAVIAMAAAPVAAAGPVLPEACHESAVGCLDALTPRATPSRVLPGSLRPEAAPEPAAAEASPGVSTAPPEAAPPAAPETPPAAPAAELVPAAASPAPSSPEEPADVAPAATSLPAARPGADVALGALIGVTTLLILLVGIMIIAVVELRSRHPKGPRTSLADAARADAMQRDIEQAWRGARHG